jgi:hypothetical protein
VQPKEEASSKTLSTSPVVAPSPNALTDELHDTPSHALECLAACLPRRLVEHAIQASQQSKSSRHKQQQQQLRRAASDDGQSRAQLHCSSFDCALLFVDISGFTSSMERFAAHGGRGTERFLAAISGYFSSLLREIYSRGGDVECFAGDALMVSFGADDIAAHSVGRELLARHLLENAEQTDSEARLAVATKVAIDAAASMLRHLSPYTRTEKNFGGFGQDLELLLTLHGSVGAGGLTATELVQAQGANKRWHFVCGPVVGQLTRAHALSAANDVVLSRQAARAAGAGAWAEPLGSGRMRMRGPDYLPPPLLGTSVEAAAAVAAAATTAASAAVAAATIAAASAAAAAAATTAAAAGDADADVTAAPELSTAGADARSDSTATVRAGADVADEPVSTFDAPSVEVALVASPMPSAAAAASAAAAVAPTPSISAAPSWDLGDSVHGEFCGWPRYEVTSLMTGRGLGHADLVALAASLLAYVPEPLAVRFRQGLVVQDAGLPGGGLGGSSSNSASSFKPLLSWLGELRPAAVAFVKFDIGELNSAAKAPPPPPPPKAARYTTQTSSSAEASPELPHTAAAAAAAAGDAAAADNQSVTTSSTDSNVSALAAAAAAAAAATDGGGTSASSSAAPLLAGETSFVTVRGATHQGFEGSMYLHPYAKRPSSVNAAALASTSAGETSQSDRGELFDLPAACLLAHVHCFSHHSS